jgi:hypothetical protein
MVTPGDDLPPGAAEIKEIVEVRRASEHPRRSQKAMRNFADGIYGIDRYFP